MLPKLPRLLGSALLLALPTAALAQTGGVRIGTAGTPDVSAALDIVSSTKGALLPRVADATTIASPATGLLVFQTGGAAGFYYNAGTPATPDWQRLTTAGAPVTASNGLTRTGQNIALGGTLTQATTIAQAGFNLNLAGTGNVGIGTGTSPAAKLTVQPGSDAEVGLRVTNGVADGTAVSGNIVLQTLTGGESGFSYLGFNGSNANGETRYNTTKNRWRLGVDQRSTGDAFFLDTYNGTTSVNALRVATDGTVGIGGNVGIGTPTPQVKLDVSVPVATPALGLRLASSAWDHIYLYHTDALAVLRAGGADDGLALQVGNATSGTYGGQTYTDVMRLLPSGNVGIGTPTPGQKLEVAGGIKFTGTGSVLTFPDGTTQSTAATGGTATSAILNQTTQQAASNFNVSGNGTVGGTLTAANAVVTTALTGSGANIGTTVGLGVRADGGLNIGQNTTGNNVLLGYAAGANTTGIENLLVGYAAGSNTSSGRDNTFSGYASGNANTTGGYNVFVGAGSGNGNSGGNLNTFTGAGSGLYNTTGSNNAALGAYSGPASGSGNLTNATAIGANVSLTQSNSVVLGSGANVGIDTPTPATKLDVNGNLRLAVRQCPTNNPTPGLVLQMGSADIAFSIFKVATGAYVPGLQLPPAGTGQVEGQEMTILNVATTGAVLVKAANTDNAADVTLVTAGTAGIHAVKYVWSGTWVRVQ